MCLLKECEQYWGSQTQEYHSKTAMMSFFSERQVDDGYKRKKMPNAANMRVSTDLNPGEMEVDEVEGNESSKISQRLKPITELNKFSETPVECLPVKDLFVPPLPKENTSGFPPPPPPPPDDSDAQSQEDIAAESNVCTLLILYNPLALYLISMYVCTFTGNAAG